LGSLFFPVSPSFSRLVASLGFGFAETGIACKAANSIGCSWLVAAGINPAWNDVSLLLSSPLNKDENAPNCPSGADAGKNATEPTWDVFRVDAETGKGLATFTPWLNATGTPSRRYHSSYTYPFHRGTKLAQIPL
jgi:hypothetical protein